MFSTVLAPALLTSLCLAGQAHEGGTTVSAPTNENDYEYGMGSGRSAEPEKPSTDYDYGLGSGRMETIQGHSSQYDSTLGKIEEEAGKLLHSKQLEEHGEEKRREAGAFKHSGKH